MRKFFKNIKNRAERAVVSVQTTLQSKKAEGYVDTGVKIIIGKGGMDGATLEAMRKHGCVYIQAVGGAAALFIANMENIVKRVAAGRWDDLLRTEARVMVTASTTVPAEPR